MRLVWFSFSFLSVILLSAVFAEGSEWGYNDVDQWANLNNTMCDGRYQSPIDLPDICTHPNDVVIDRSLKLLLNNYDRPINGEKVTIENNGHTAVVHINGTDTVSDDSPWITGSALGGYHFQLQQIHFHWNRNGSHEGSEHAIEGRKTSFEMHLVHFNTKYDAFKNAGDHPDGSAVLSVLFDFEDCNPADSTCSGNTNDNPALNPILGRIAKVENADDAVVLDHLTLDLRALLPDNIDTFYWYQGSLTTPPCSEDLTWIVFPEIQPISRNQLHTFEYNFKNDNGKILGTTNRDLQPLNGRILLISNDNHCRKKNTNGLIGKATNGVLSLVSDIVSK